MGLGTCTADQTWPLFISTGAASRHDACNEKGYKPNPAGLSSSVLSGCGFSMLRCHLLEGLNVQPRRGAILTTARLKAKARRGSVSPTPPGAKDVSSWSGPCA